MARYVLHMRSATTSGEERRNVSDIVAYAGTSDRESHFFWYYRRIDSLKLSQISDLYDSLPNKMRGIPPGSVNDG